MLPADSTGMEVATPLKSGHDPGKYYGAAMLNSSEFILLHTTKFGENSIVLHTLSKVYGRKGLFVKSMPRRSMTSLFFPLSILEADIYETSRSKLFTARNVSSRYPLAGIRNNLSKSAMSMFISEVIYRVVRDGMNDPALYDMCERNILLLDALETDFSNFHLYFLLEFIIALGFSPDPDALAPFVGDRLPAVSRFVELPFSEAMLVPMSGELRNEIAEKLLKYIEYHTESSVNVNSLKVLRELFR